MVVVLAFYAGSVVAAASLGRWLGARIFWVAALAPTATLVWLGMNHDVVAGGPPARAGITWVGELGLHVDVRVDAFSYVMTALVAAIGVLVFAYARVYFDGRADAGRCASLLVAFAAAMIGIFVADNIFLLYVAWELTSVTSYLLIGLEHEKPAARAAALQAILVTGAGGLAMLGGLVLIAQEAGSYTISAILSAPPDGHLVGVGLALVLLGAFTKSAQFPFHAWLPGAMAAPTPVSAYLHSATMVKAGVYLVARLSPAFAGAYMWWRPTIVAVGVTTMVYGALRAMREHDLKLLLAFGTVSQLGFLVVMLGIGRPELTFAGVAVLVAHALFKAGLFLVVGIIDHQTHTRDLRSLTGLARAMPATFVVAAVAVASMAGLPPLFGFVAKEAAFEGLLGADTAPSLQVALVGLVVGSALTFAYGARFLWGAFASKSHAGVRSLQPFARPSSAFLFPATVLAAASLAFGVVPALADEPVANAAGALDPVAGTGHLLLWHGWTTALALSVLTYAVGGFLFTRRATIERLVGRMRRDDGPTLYRWSITGLNRVADRVTGVVQNGSLPAYLGVILVTVLVVPGVALVSAGTFPDDLRVADTPLQLGVVIFVATAALATARAHRRFAAVLLLGAVGFGVAVLFVVQGAPDLALTQLLVETLLLVMFVLVLRFLPDDFPAQTWRPATALRIAIAACVGAFVAGFSLIAAGVRIAPPISETYLERALTDAGGRNVVNVILVDFRAFDTLGEITVLVVAALGIASLVLAGRMGSEGSEA